MREVSGQEVNRDCVAELGLDAEILNLESIEAIAASIRRIASFLCPSPGAVLKKFVLQAMEGVASDPDRIREVVESTLDALVNYGDLLELDEVSHDHQGRGRLLYGAPPAFVMRESGTALILGIPSEHSSIVPERLLDRLESINHIRRLGVGEEKTEVAEILREHGLIQLTQEYWANTPRAVSPSNYLSRVRARLQNAAPSTDISGLRIIDPESSVKYYRGRWIHPDKQTGFFVGRRSQQFGADLWCVLELKDGGPQRFLDLPLEKEVRNPWDEAWRIQLAMDNLAGSPQEYRIRQGLDGASIFDLFSPVPSWAQRRWDGFATPVEAGKCLMSYRINESDLEEEVKFLEEMLWLARVNG